MGTSLHPNGYPFTMRFLVIASVLAFVAAEPETFHHLGAHATAGYAKHMNGAVVPEDTASVKAAKGLHMAAKHNAALNGYAMPYVYQPLVKPVAPVVKTVEVESPKVVSYKAPVVTYAKPVVTQPITYTVPTAHHVAAPITTYTHPIALHQRCLHYPLHLCQPLGVQHSLYHLLCPQDLHLHHSIHDLRISLCPPHHCQA